MGLTWVLKKIKPYYEHLNSIRLSKKNYKWIYHIDTLDDMIIEHSFKIKFHNKISLDLRLNSPNLNTY